jgi:hypothetical protein
MLSMVLLLQTKNLLEEILRVRQLHSLFRFSARVESRDWLSKEILVPDFTVLSSPVKQVAGGLGFDFYLIGIAIFEVHDILVDS